MIIIIFVGRGDGTNDSRRRASGETHLGGPGAERRCDDAWQVGREE